MRLALTGGTGFVGGYVLRAALRRGHGVVALARSEPALSHPSSAHPNLRWIRGGLGEADAELVAGADALINIAGLVKARTREAFMRTNAEAVAALADVLEPGARFVQVSSLAAREPQLSAYAHSKREGERALEGRANTAILRPPAVFGPGDEATKPFFAAMLSGFLPVPGGRGWRSRRLGFVYAPDLADAILDAAEGEGTRRLTYPATLASTTWEGFRDLAQDALGKPVRILPIPAPVLLAVAAGTSVTSRLAGIGHLTLDKLREFQHPDWGVEGTLPGATPIIDALKATFESYS